MILRFNMMKASHYTDGQIIVRLKELEETT
ncbi:hypothetical protein BOTU111922_22775 [Bordetella tumulicola]